MEITCNGYIVYHVNETNIQRALSATDSRLLYIVPVKWSSEAQACWLAPSCSLAWQGFYLRCPRCGYTVEQGFSCASSTSMLINAQRCCFRNWWIACLLQRISHSLSPSCSYHNFRPSLVSTLHHWLCSLRINIESNIMALVLKLPVHPRLYIPRTRKTWW